MDHKEKYYQQNLGQVWTFDAYGGYLKAQWDWVFLPFDDDFTKPNRSWRPTVAKPIIKCSVVEIGSAMGQGFNALQNRENIDFSDYTGIEVSDQGVAKARERFPNTNWIHADFTKYEFNRNYDYGYERHSIHHMPEPVGQIKKILKHINISFSTTFIGCIQEGTISDLNKCHHKNAGKGLVYFDIISIPEIVRAGLDEGFNHIRILYWGKLEPISSYPESDPYMAPELIGQRDYARYTVRLTKCQELKAPLIYSVMAGPLGGVIKWFKYPREVFRMQKGVNELQTRFVGVN